MAWLACYSQHNFEKEDFHGLKNLLQPTLFAPPGSCVVKRRYPIFSHYGSSMLAHDSPFHRFILHQKTYETHHSRYKTIPDRKIQMNTRIFIRKTRSLLIRIANFLDRYLQRTDESVSDILKDPVNHRLSTYDERDITADARYDLAIAESYIEILPEGRASLQGKSVLELGPGLSFGTILVLKAFGARSAHVADRFLTPFHAEYHPKVYRLLAQLVQEKYPDLDTSILLQAAERGHIPDVVQTCNKPLEELGGVFQNIDITLSNAVLEHLYDQFQAIKVLHTITANGGMGFHQVDFRDHCDFSKPLEYLLLNDIDFAHLFEISHGECGQRTRPFQMEAMFKSAGFSSVNFRANMEAEPAYFEDIFQRLRNAPNNLYGYMPQDHLTTISGRFHVFK